jgi:hypothetical protein
MAFQTDNYLGTTQLIANQPQYFSLAFYASGDNAVDGAGLAIRNMVANTQVDITSGYMRSYRIKQ